MATFTNDTWDTIAKTFDTDLYGVLNLLLEGTIDKDNLIDTIKDVFNEKETNTEKRLWKDDKWVIHKVGEREGEYNMTLRKVLTKDDILRYNMHSYWNRLSFKEKTWLIDHVLLTKDKTIIHFDDAELGYGEELIDMLSTKLLT